jgi:hypothetical protein
VSGARPGGSEPAAGRRAARRSRAESTSKALARCVAALALAAACGPIPGGSLEGREAAAPAQWSSALPEERAFCEIEARPADPHSIQLECFLHDGSLYVQSHRFALASWWPVQSWAAVWLEHPDVRLRLGDAIFPVRAVRVPDGAERDTVLRFRGYEPVPAGIALFRFEPRP